MSRQRSFLLAWPLLIASGFMLASPATAQQTFHACYVPDVGAMYLIKITGLPANCLSASHVEISWTEGGTGEVADGSITTAKLADGAVTGIKLAEGAVTSGHIAEGAVTTSKIAEGAVTGLKIGEGAVATPNILDAAVTTGKLADGAVAGVKIAEMTVVAGHIANGAVETAKLAEGSVTSTKIGEGVVINAHLADGAVTPVKLADGAVTAPKLNVVWRSSARGISATHQNHVLQCEIGERVIAGGAELLGTASTGFYVRGSHPDFDVGPDLNDGWRVQVVNTTGIFQEFTLWVLCAAP